MNPAEKNEDTGRKIDHASCFIKYCKLVGKQASTFSSRSASLQLSPLSVLNCCWPWGVCTCTSICGEAETVMAHRLGLYGGWDLIGGLRHVASAVFGTIPAIGTIVKKG
eukprot:939384-Pelagomonas_calceolata.AAC.2